MHHFITIISLLIAFTLFGQNFVEKGSFEGMQFRNKINHVENGFTQLKLLEDFSWLPFSPEDVKVYFEKGESKYAAINISQNEYVQTQFCCFPTKGLEYEVKVTTRLNESSKNGVSYIRAYLLSKPYEPGNELNVLQELILTFDSKTHDWQEISSTFISKGEERYILIGSKDDSKADILVDINKEGFQDDIILDLQSIAVRLYSGQKEKSKGAKKMEF